MNRDMALIIRLLRRAEDARGGPSDPTATADIEELEERFEAGVADLEDRRPATAAETGP